MRNNYIRITGIIASLLVGLLILVLGRAIFKPELPPADNNEQAMILYCEGIYTPRNSEKLEYFTKAYALASDRSIRCMIDHHIDLTETQLAVDVERNSDSILLDGLRGTWGWLKNGRSPAVYLDMVRLGLLSDDTKDCINDAFSVYKETLMRRAETERKREHIERQVRIVAFWTTFTSISIVINLNSKKKRTDAN